MHLATQILEKSFCKEIARNHKWSPNPLTPMSDQDRISPYIINTILSGNVMRIKYYKSIQYQILQTNITRTVCQTVRRIANEILGA